MLLIAAVLPLVGAALVPHAPPPPAAAGPLRATVRPGIGLMLVNIGYAATLAFGGPAAGALATLGGATGALLGAVVAVACTAPIALISTVRPAGGPLVN